MVCFKNATPDKMLNTKVPVNRHRSQTCKPFCHPFIHHHSIISPRQRQYLNFPVRHNLTKLIKAGFTPF